MSCSSSFCVALLLIVAEPDVEPSGPEPHVVDAMVEGLDPATRSERLYSQAVEYAEEQRFHDAAVSIVKAYEILPEDTRYSDTGLILLAAGTEYHLIAHRQTNDEALLAAIHPLLEDLIEHYQGLDPKIDVLRRKLDTIRMLRLDVSDRYFREKKYTSAAIEAGACYRALQAVDQGKAIGERAVLAASTAYRRAWYVDGDIRHLDGAIELVSDHLSKAGEHASSKAKHERARLERNLVVATARGGGISDEEDLGGIAPHDRSFLIVSGAALGGGLALSAGASAVGAYGFDLRILPATSSVVSIDGRPEHIATAIPLGVVGGVVTGLAIHSMVDTGFIPPRERKILAVTATAVGLLGAVAGSSLLALGATREDDLTSTRARGLQNAGFSILVGIGAPLGAGLAALISRRAGRR